ncbi:MAG TPA: PLP-dependent aminotransferase family protein [Anaerolineaceae bacterium]|nr:PLP-dependent aminotransferase family protein [Anaerolineaceae bacterium]
MADLQIVEKIPLYEQLVNEMARQIAQGTFRPGERIPSVRRTSQQKNMSITTVLQAYQILEDRGVIEARPQSGYFVRAPQEMGSFPEPECSDPPIDPTHVNIGELAIRVVRDSANPNMVQFGAAIPDPELLPTRRLNRILAALARREDIPQYLCGVPEGLEELRIQTAQRMFSAGCMVTPDDLTITSGCVEALSLSLKAVCKPGDLVAIESPTYFVILQALEILGLQALEIPTHHRTGMSLEALRFALDHHPVRAVLVIPNFHNPLGSLMPVENKRELVEMLAGRHIPLIEDDIYGELYFEGQRPPAAKSFDKEGLVLYCSSYSKDISPSYRVGWVAAGRYKKQIEQIKMATNVGTALLPQMAIARFIASGGYDHLLRRIRRAYAQKMAQMSAAVLRYFPAGTRVTNPSGGFVLWVQLPENVDSLELYSLALKARINLAPGYIFSSTPRYSNFIRLNAAYMNEGSEKAILKLGSLVERLAEK